MLTTCHPAPAALGVGVALAGWRRLPLVAQAGADSTGEWIGSELRFWAKLEAEASAADLAATLSWNKNACRLNC
jgi:hypothetical protein